jgi:hypothetical protein
MARREELEIEISPDGRITVRVKGVPGKECLEASRFLEEALGRRVTRELTPEYYQEQEESEEEIRRKRP